MNKGIHMLNKNALPFYMVLLVFALLSLLWFSSESLIIAQSDPLPLPDSTEEAPEYPDGPPVEQSEEMSQEDMNAIATAQAEFESRSISDYRTAYLIEADTAAGNEFITEENVMETIGAEGINTWEDFLILNEEHPFQIILVHVSMLDAVDLEWLHDAYRNNVIIVGINFTQEQMQILTGDACLKDMNPDRVVGDFTGSFLTFVYTVSAVDESLYETIHQAELIDCTDYDARGAKTSVVHGQYQFELEQQSHLEQLVGVLTMSTMNYDLPKSER
jgi:hypothetical protein